MSYLQINVNTIYSKRNKWKFQKTTIKLKLNKQHEGHDDKIK